MCLRSQLHWPCSHEFRHDGLRRPRSTLPSRPQRRCRPVLAPKLPDLPPSFQLQDFCPVSSNCAVVTAVLLISFSSLGSQYNSPSCCRALALHYSADVDLRLVDVVPQFDAGTGPVFDTTQPPPKTLLDPLQQAPTSAAEFVVVACTTLAVATKPCSCLILVAQIEGLLLNPK
jgi:hypothetical protein